MRSLLGGWTISCDDDGHLADNTTTTTAQPIDYDLVLCVADARSHPPPPPLLRTCSPIKQVKASPARRPCRNQPKTSVSASLLQCSPCHCSSPEVFIYRDLTIDLVPSLVGAGGCLSCLAGQGDVFQSRKDGRVNWRFPENECEDGKSD